MGRKCMAISGLRRYVFRVKLSVKSDYAARAVLGLARHYAEGTALRAEALAAERTEWRRFAVGVQTVVGWPA